jgi:hypothetical protein
MIKENDKYFMTEYIFRYQNKLYYQHNNNIIKLNNNIIKLNNNIIKLNNKNWYKFLKEYGWERLPKIWKSKFINKNNYGILDCGGNGDCMFHCLAEALNEPFNINNLLYDTDKLRNIAAQEINTNNFSFILENYKIEKNNEEFQGNWDPNNIRNIKELQNEIKIPGDNFLGDHILLQLLQEKLKINIIILKTNLINEEINIQYLCENNDKTVVLYYIYDLHYQLVGYFNGNYIQTYFYKNELPKDLRK